MIAQNFNQDWVYHKDDQAELTRVILPHDAMIHDERRPDSPGGSANAWFIGGKYIYEKEFTVPGDWQDRHAELWFGGVYKNATVSLNGKKVAFRPYGYIPFEAVLDGLCYGEKNVLRVEADNSRLPNSRWYSGGGIYRGVRLALSERNTYIPRYGIRIRTLATDPAQIEMRITVAGQAAQQSGQAEQKAGLRAKIEICDGSEVVCRAACADLAEPVRIGIPDAKLWTADAPQLYHYRVTLLAQETADGGEQICDTAEGTFGIRTLQWSSRGFFVNGKRVLLQGACIHHDNGVVGAAEIPEMAFRRIRILKENGYNAIRMSHHPASEEILKACDALGMYVMDETFDMWYEKKNPYDYALDFNDWHERDIEAMVAKDYNHPSVVLYSIGNEIGEPGKPEGVTMGRELVQLLHSLDEDRPVTEGTNLMLILMTASGKGLYDEGGLAAKKDGPAQKDGPVQKDGPATEREETAAPGKASGSLLFNQLVSRLGKLFNKLIELPQAGRAGEPMLSALDIAGMNYALGRYKKDHRNHPDWVLLGTETYAEDIYKAWMQTRENPALIGDFMWTGWDYLGEAGIGSWNDEGVSMMNVAYPWLLADAGAIDITGYPGAEAAYARVVWDAAAGNAVASYLGVRPVNQRQSKLIRGAWRWTNAIASWSWHGCEGNEAVVEVYAKGAYARLFINDREVGKKALKELKCTFKTIYEPGTLKACIYDDRNQLVSTAELRTAVFDETGQPKVVIEQEASERTEAFLRESGKAGAAGDDEGDILIYDISLQGENGVTESNMDKKCKLQIEGGELIGFGSANPKSPDSFCSGEYETYHGRALAVVRRTADEVRVRVEG